LLWAKRFIVDGKSAPLVWSLSTSTRVGAEKGVSYYQEAFTHNKIGMMLGSSVMYLNFKSALPDKLGVAGLPSTREGVHVNVPGASYLVIPKESKNKQAAWDLVASLLLQAQENASWNAANYDFLPVIRDPSETNADAAIFSREMDFARDISLRNELFYLFDPYMEQILKSPDADMHGILTRLAGEFDNLPKETNSR
jgi:ABC-type glycerol-3-phosphate transport system substrate-binding protein